MKRVAIIGAGPIGLFAALGCVERGHDVTVLEQGEVGDALRRWGPTRFFTPLGMNVHSGLWPKVRAALPAPDEQAHLTGPEFADRVLAPLARTLLDGKVRERRRVVAVGRARLLKGELAGHPLRNERSFRLLVEGPAGEELLEADRVLDASGVYGRPTALGAGGLPAAGERALADRFIRDLGALAWHRARLAGKRVLLVGHGHSAAHAVVALDELAREHAGTRVTWAVRSANQRPVVEVAADPLPQRQSIVERANLLASRPPPHLAVERRAHVEAIAEEGDALRVTLSGGRAAVADELVALTGYRPDAALLGELAVELSPRTEGGARLDRAICGVTDCLSQPAVAADDLESGEPGLYLVGARSYGRARTFLLENGYRQLDLILDRL
jgi:thioredoxin reductase